MNNPDSDNLEISKFLWDEYRYRHDLIWQRIFRFTTAIVVISIIPYVRKDIVEILGNWILIAPALAVILSAFVGLVLLNELDVFDKIKTTYRDRQNVLLGKDIHENGNKWLRFGGLVTIFCFFLAVLSIANLIVVWLVWIPEVT